MTRSALAMVMLAASTASAEPPLQHSWKNLPALWEAIRVTYGKAIESCGGDSPVVFRIERGGDGKPRATHRLTGRTAAAVESCRKRAVAAIQVPPLPANLVAIDFTYSFKPISWQTDEWKDPMATIHSGLSAVQLGKCVYTPASTYLFSVDQISTSNPRVKAPEHQFLGTTKDGGKGKLRCLNPLLANSPVPRLPPFLLAIVVKHRIVGLN